MAHPGKTASSWRERLGAIGPRLAHFWHKEIWLSSHLKDSTPRGLLYACLRVVSISATVFKETKAASRAAALSFSSLLGLGPLVALTVLIAGFALEKTDVGGLSAFKLQPTDTNQDEAKAALTALDANISELKDRTDKMSNAADRDAAKRQVKLFEGRSDELKSQFNKARFDALVDDVLAQWNKTMGRNKVAVDALGRLINFVAPQLGAREAELSPNETAPVNPKLLELLDNFISGARKGSAGVFGIFTLILIVLLLFKTVEDTFNEIWGVRSGRSLIMRIVYYWTVLTLGAVLFFASVTLLSAGYFMSKFKALTGDLPFNEQLARLLQWSFPLLSFLLLVVLLTAFYRVIPNTRVYRRAAFMGAVVVGSLLMLNNFLAFLYVKRVILEESLYGSLGILPVLMFGLYIFWLYVLVGGQISYAVQNVHFRNSQAAWSSLTETMRERLCLLALLTICRRFQACQPPVSASELSTLIKVPTQILNECINRLVDIKLVTPIPPPANAPTTELLYQPVRPLNRLSLWEFKRLDDNLGEAPTGVAMEGLDPILNRYDAALNHLGEQPFFQKTLEELFAEFAFDGPRAPSHAPGVKK